MREPTLCCRRCEPLIDKFDRNRRNSLTQCVHIVTYDDRRVTFLPALPNHAVRAANAAELPFVVIGDVVGIADAFSSAGWRLQPLGAYWTLAIRTSSPISG